MSSSTRTPPARTNPAGEHPAGGKSPQTEARTAPTSWSMPVIGVLLGSGGSAAGEGLKSDVKGARSARGAAGAALRERSRSCPAALPALPALPGLPDRRRSPGQGNTGLRSSVIHPALEKQETWKCLCSSGCRSEQTSLCAAIKQRKLQRKARGRLNSPAPLKGNIT